ncbi:hypothetical protein VNO77_31950 [Canavalia gladiata]|uniref:Uncharacterized protein n=1 Tax=Canavalia gladiata TaxID=3824 RepID=A0AAN9KRF7_CANGL
MEIQYLAWKSPRLLAGILATGEVLLCTNPNAIPLENRGGITPRPFLAQNQSKSDALILLHAPVPPCLTTILPLFPNILSASGGAQGKDICPLRENSGILLLWSLNLSCYAK